MTEQSDSVRACQVGEGHGARRIAFMSAPATSAGGPSLFWLSGFMSDMNSTKASALAEFARDKGYGFTAFDYSGHGRSGGDFKDGTISRWLEEALAILQQHTSGPQIVIGSSMGGHIALLLMRLLRTKHPSLARRIQGVVLIAPAWDMTEVLMWNQLPEAAQRDIIDNGFHLRPSAYDAPYTITRDLIEDGRQHLFTGTTFDPGCPVIILQGMQDPDVPADHTRKLLDILPRQRVSLIEIEDGEHRLSRPQDLQRLTDAVSEIAET